MDSFQTRFCFRFGMESWHWGVWNNATITLLVPRIWFTCRMPDKVLHFHINVTLLLVYGTWIEAQICTCDIIPLPDIGHNRVLRALWTPWCVFGWWWCCQTRFALHDLLTTFYTQLHHTSINIAIRESHKLLLSRKTTSDVAQEVALIQTLAEHFGFDNISLIVSFHLLWKMIPWSHFSKIDINFCILARDSVLDRIFHRQDYFFI